MDVGSFAEVMVGLALKRKEATQIDTNRYRYPLLTLKSFNSEGWIDKNYLEFFESSEILDSRYLSLENDVLVKLTPPYTAIAIDQSFVGCVISSQFAIVRFDSRKFNPDYLALFFNSSKVKNYISISATGVTVPILKTGTLREIEVPILEMARQKKVAEISKLIVRERHLLYKLLSKKEQYYQALTEALILEEE